MPDEDIVEEEDSHVSQIDRFIIGTAIHQIKATVAYKDSYEDLDINLTRGVAAIEQWLESEQ
jgi:hypothetical protein